MINCSACNKELRANSKFCSFCGNQQLLLKSSDNEIATPVSVQLLPTNEKNVDLNNETTTNTNLNFLSVKFLFIVAFFGAAALITYSSHDKKNEQITKSYKELRSEILSSGWKVYKRHNEIEWNKLYPEIDWCEEDICQSSFINTENTKVREIQFSICSADGYIKCPDMPNGFEQIDKDIVVSKAESDKNFLRLIQRFEKRSDIPVRSEPPKALESRSEIPVTSEPPKALESRSESLSYAEQQPVPSQSLSTTKSSTGSSAQFIGSCTAPYPSMSRRMNEKGTVVVKVLVKSDGTAGDVELKSSSGYPRLDQAWLEAIKTCRFTPSTNSDGKPIDEWLSAPNTFRLN